jgi:hypothetical protein
MEQIVAYYEVRMDTDRNGFANLNTRQAKQFLKKTDSATIETRVGIVVFYVITHPENISGRFTMTYCGLVSVYLMMLSIGQIIYCRMMRTTN